MRKKQTSTDEKLDAIAFTLNHLLAIELAREGVKREQIAKHLHVATSTVVAMLKGTKREKSK